MFYFTLRVSFSLTISIWIKDNFDKIPFLNNAVVTMHTMLFKIIAVRLEEKDIHSLWTQYFLQDIFKSKIKRKKKEKFRYDIANHSLVFVICSYLNIL
jgi:hypothetical protein